MKNVLVFIFTFAAWSSNGMAANVLYIGDSHSAGHFGKTLDGLIRNSGESIATFAKGGSQVGSWLSGSPTPWGLFKRSLDGQITYGAANGRTPRLSYLIESHRPTKIIVALGTNNVGQTSETFKGEIIQMLESIQASGAKCLWVTPPASRSILAEVPRLKANILDVVSNYCTTFQSDYVTSYPLMGGDGLHFANYPGAKAMAQYWALRVFKKFKKEL